MTAPRTYTVVLSAAAQQTMEHDLPEPDAFYPSSTHARTLADRAGLDAARISWTGSGRRIIPELLSVASRSGRLSALVEAVLDDPAAVAVRGRLRALTGTEPPGPRGGS